MSWLSEFAGKAEGLLNQIDQSAATVLHKPTRSNVPGKSTYSLHGDSTSAGSGGGAILTQTSSVQRPGTSTGFDYSPKREHRSSGYASSVSSFVTKPQAKDEEDKLIEYLNESNLDKPPTTPLSRRSSASSLRSLPILFQTQSSGTETAYTENADASNKKSQPEATKHSSVKPIVAPVPFIATKAAEREIQELKAREADLHKALQAKDSQLAVLRVRLQDADQQLQSKVQRLQKLEHEQERLLKDSVDSTTCRTEALETLEKQYKDVEHELEREKHAFKRSESDYLARIQRLEYEQSNIMQQLTSVQKDLTDEKIRCKDFGEQLKLAKYNLEANKLEFDEYKQKAQRILQSKEKLITTLKEGDQGDSSSSETVNLKVLLEELKTERDILKDDLQQAHLQMYNVKADMQELETQLATEQRSSLEQQRQLQDQCQTYQQTAAQYREQFEQLKQDYQYIQDEMRRQHLALQTKLQEKDAEISRLLNQSAYRPSTFNNENELEGRIRHLTENLIQKQTLIEALQTDKQSLSLQLERMERMYREAESAAIRASSTAIDMGSAEEGVHSRIPSFLKESPYDTQVTRGVKKAYSTVDSLSVKVGLFLRRYPMARLCIFLYMILLHLWVMVVLLTYTPEAHSSDYHPGENKLGGGLPPNL